MEVMQVINGSNEVINGIQKKAKKHLHVHQLELHTSAAIPE